MRPERQAPPKMQRSDALRLISTHFLEFHIFAQRTPMARSASVLGATGLPLTGCFVQVRDRTSFSWDHPIMHSNPFGNFNEVTSKCAIATLTELSRDGWVTQKRTSISHPIARTPRTFLLGRLVLGKGWTECSKEGGPVLFATTNNTRGDEYIVVVILCNPPPQIDKCAHLLPNFVVRKMKATHSPSRYGSQSSNFGSRIQIHI
jgi:hypothetical protein